jgi:phage virion morphogenesis protein
MQMIVYVDAKQVQANLAKLASAVSDLTPAMRGIGEQLETSITRRFDTKTDPTGRAWEPYKAVSAAIHQARHGKQPQGSLLQRHTPGMHTGVEHHASADSVEVGLTAPYAQYHEFGTNGRTSKNGKQYGVIPRRGMVFGTVVGTGASAQVVKALSASDEADVMDILQRHIEQAISGLS